MVRFTVRNRIVLGALTLWLVCVLAISGGCKKKAEPEDTQQAVPTEKKKHIAVTEQIDEAGVPEKIGLRILYAGHPDSDREKDFTNFLAKHFRTVETGDLKNFKESQTDGFDVTILDYDGDGFNAPRPRISTNFSRPVVTVGVAGALMCSIWQLKTGYM